MANQIPTIAGIWGQFHEQVVPANAGPVQLRETRRTFYAACYAMLVLLRDDLAELPEEQAMKALDSLHEECLAFSRRVGKGDI